MDTSDVQVFLDRIIGDCYCGSFPLFLGHVGSNDGQKHSFYLTDSKHAECCNERILLEMKPNQFLTVSYASLSEVSFTRFVVR